MKRSIAQPTRLFANMWALTFALILTLFVSGAGAQGERATESTGQLVKPTLENPPSGGEASEPTATGTAAVAIGESSVDKRIRVPTAADDARAQKLLNDLARQSGWFPELKISVASGMVTIDGHVKNADQLAWLAKTADRLPTVVAVINRATVDQPAVTDLTPAWTEFVRIINKAKSALPTLLLAAVLLTFFYFISRTVSRGVNRLWATNITNPFLLATLSKISMIPIWMLFFYLTLQTAGLSSLATTIIGGTGVVGIVIGFAFKDIAENYLSGLLLAIRSPFTKGDDISVAGFDGYVQALNMRGTTILDYEGNLVLIPNSIVIKEVIKNRSTNPATRLMFTIGIGYCDSTTHAQELILQAISEIPAVLKDPGPMVVVSGLGSATVNMNAYFWIDSVKSSSLKSKSAAISRAKELLLANGITLPDESREIVFTDALKIQLLRSGEQIRAIEYERSEASKSRATTHLNESEKQVRDTHATSDEDVKQLGTQVDMLDRGSNDERLLNYGDEKTKAHTS